jgi:predicted aspartyl protease
MMGAVYIDIGVGHPSGGDFTPIHNVLVDTGAANTMLPKSLMTRLHIEPLEYDQWEFADGSVHELGFAMARISIDDRTFHCPVIIGPENQYLVGSTTLETFRLMVDPVGQELVPRTFRSRAI